MVKQLNKLNIPKGKKQLDFKNIKKISLKSANMK